MFLCFYITPLVVLAVSAMVVSLLVYFGTFSLLVGHYILSLLELQLEVSIVNKIN